MAVPLAGFYWTGYLWSRVPIHNIASFFTVIVCVQHVANSTVQLVDEGLVSLGICLHYTIPKSVCPIWQKHGLFAFIIFYCHSCTCNPEFTQVNFSFKVTEYWAVFTHAWGVCRIKVELVNRSLNCTVWTMEKGELQISVLYMGSIKEQ